MVSMASTGKVIVRSVFSGENSRPPITWKRPYVNMTVQQALEAIRKDRYINYDFGPPMSVNGKPVKAKSRRILRDGDVLRLDP